MTYDEDLADRIRTALQHHDGVTEKRMFGGLAFLVRGHLAVSASSRGGLLLRVEADATDHVVREQGVTRFEMRGRELRGWVHVDRSVVSSDEGLARWVALGVACAEALPPK